LAEISVLPVADGELPVWVALRNEVDPRLPATVEGMQRGRALERTLQLVLARLDDRPVGVGLALEQGDMRHTDVAVGFFGVVEHSRGTGVGRALCRAVSEHARALAKTTLQVDLWEDDHEGLRFLGRRGFKEVERFERVQLQLADGSLLPDVSLPPGLEVVPLEGRLDLAPALYAIAEEAYADMPSTDPIAVSYDDWCGWEIRRETLRHDLGRVALADGAPVGFGTITVTPGFRTGWHSLTAVAREWRRRGVATAIKRAEIEAAREAALEALTTFSEIRNIPMRALNARLGYRPLAPQLRLRGPLAEDASDPRV
jgi:mycothiol synthase